MNICCFRNTVASMVAPMGSRVYRGFPALSAAIVISLLLSVAAGADGNIYQIAVIGPFSGKDRAGGQAMLDGVNLCVAEINESGGINGRKLAVLVYDDQNIKDITRNKATAIARDSNALAVIGHYYSSTSIEGGIIYKQYGIPAVTSIATAPQVTEGNPWYFRVVPDTRLQGKLAAIYTHEILKQNNIYVVYEKDAYGSSLHGAFTRTAREIGLHIRRDRGVNTKADDVDTILKKIRLDLQGDENIGALYLALQDHEAAKMVRLIRDGGIDLTIIGGDAIGSESFPRKFKDTHKKRGGHAHYTDGIYATTFFIRDIGNFKAQQFSHAFKRRFGREADDMAATSYDAAAIIVEAIRRARPGGDLKKSRERIRSQLMTFNSIETAKKGVTGRTYFDEHGNAIKPFPFGVYLKGKLISAPVQIKQIVNPQATVDLNEKLENGSILAIDDLFLYKTTAVYTGIDINEIRNINPENGTFSADFYLWFRHSGFLDHGQIEFINAVKPIHLSDPIMKRVTDDVSHRAYRIKGEFREAFTFRDYPFDSQTLNIRLCHKTIDNNGLLFVADDIGMQRDGAITPTKGPEERSILDPVGEWHLQNVIVFSDISATESTLGNPGMFHATADTDIHYSRFNVTTEIERDAKNYVLNNLIPLFIIILLGYTMLYVSPQGPPFVARMNLGVTALLTAILLSLKASSHLPNIGYLVALDYIYFATYALILSGVIISVAELSADRQGRHLLVKRLEVFGRIFQPIFFFTAIGIFLFLYA